MDRLRESEHELVRKNMRIKELEAQLNMSNQGIQMLSSQLTELKKEHERLRTQLLQDQEDIQHLSHQRMNSASVKRDYSEVSDDYSNLFGFNPQKLIPFIRLICRESEMKRLAEENKVMKTQLEEYEKKERESTLESELFVLKQQFADMEKV